MINHDEKLITLSEAAKLFPARRNGKKVHASSIWRWTKYGVLVNNNKVYLEYIATPSGAATTAEAVFRFLHALNDRVKCSPPHGPSPAVINQQLDEIGI